MVNVFQVRLDGIFPLAHLIQPIEVISELGLSCCLMLLRLTVIGLLGGNLPLELRDLLLQHCLLVHILLIYCACKLLSRYKFKCLHLLRKPGVFDQHVNDLVSNFVNIDRLFELVYFFSNGYGLPPLSGDCLLKLLNFQVALCELWVRSFMTGVDE